MYQTYLSARDQRVSQHDFTDQIQFYPEDRLHFSLPLSRKHQRLPEIVAGKLIYKGNSSVVYMYIRGIG